MELFDEGRTDEYLNLNSDKIKKEIYQMSDEEIMTCDFTEWCDYLYEKYKVLPIILYEESMEQTIIETKVKKYNPFFSSRIYDQEYFLIDGVNITYKIPYDGDDSLLHLKPTHYWIYDNFDVNFLEAPYNEQCGSIEISLDYTNKELHDKGQQMQEYVRENLENKFRNYRIIIGHINAEVNSYNDKLKEYILKCLDERKQRATSINLISKMLEIPLKKSKNAPNVHPITLERITRAPVAKPTKKILPNEYSISDKDYENINNIILMNGTTMEQTARTYYKNNEEELRDHLLATLNTHYQNATGETFRKVGKTDINIEFDNKAAFIAECKIWYGEKAFNNAIQQLLNYSTWKDLKLSLIIFNKENRSFINILEKIEKWVKENTKSYSVERKNVWNCVYYRNDMEVNIKLNISVFDLYIDEQLYKNK